MTLKDPKRVARGKKSRLDGAAFERKVRADLESKGWIVDKWTNNIDLVTDRMHSARTNRYNMRSTGFPDFIAFRTIGTLKHLFEMATQQSNVWSSHL